MTLPRQSESQGFCPSCNGEGSLFFPHVSGDPQRDRFEPCPDCHGAGVHTPLLVRVDSITSLIAHRHAGGLPDDVRHELLDISQECRTLSDKDALAVALAEAWWPDRYVGDLSEPEWRRVYEALERPA